MNDNAIWECKPRTRVKLEILQSYLGAWFSIIGSSFQSALYFDGFCGPGKYSGGEDGSPIIALRHASKACATNPKFRPILIFNDRDKAACENVANLIAYERPHTNVQYFVTNKEFTSYSKDIASRLSAKSQFPTFSFIDPFGFKDTPLETVSRLLSGDRSECFINFWAGWANRFIGHPDAEVRGRVRELLGGEYIEQVMKSDDRISTIMQIYQARLMEKARFVKPFQMLDEGNVRDNTLIFCGQIAKGFIKMKEAMWRVDPEFGNRFSAFEHIAAGESGQRKMFLGPDVNVLRRDLLRYLADKEFLTCKDLFDWVDAETMFLRKHAKIALSEYVASGRLAVFGPDGKQRRKDQWPDDFCVKLSDGKRLFD